MAKQILVMLGVKPKKGDLFSTIAQIHHQNCARTRGLLFDVRLPEIWVQRVKRCVIGCESTI